MESCSLVCESAERRMHPHGKGRFAAEAADVYLR